MLEMWILQLGSSQTTKYACHIKFLRFKTNALFFCAFPIIKYNLPHSKRPVINISESNKRLFFLTVFWLLTIHSLAFFKGTIYKEREGVHFFSHKISPFSGKRDLFFFFNGFYTCRRCVKWIYQNFAVIVIKNDW